MKKVMIGYFKTKFLWIHENFMPKEINNLPKDLNLVNHYKVVCILPEA